MTRKEIEDKVRAFLIDDLEIDEDKIKDDAQLKADLGIDSLDLVDIVVIVEKNFGFKIKPEEMKEVVTLKDFCDYIERKVNKSGVCQKSSGPATRSARQLCTGGL